MNYISSMELYNLFLEEGINLNEITEEAVQKCMLDFKLSEYNPVLVHIGINGKTCSGCKQTKLFAEFDRQKLGKYGYRSTCKKCRRVAEQPNNKKYYEKNIEFIKLRKQEYRQTHKEQILEYNRKYVSEHKEWAKAIDKKYKKDGRYKVRQRQYYIKNKDKIILHSKLYRKNNPKKRTDESKRKAVIYNANRYKNDIKYRVKHNLRARIYKVLKGTRKYINFMNNIGCSLENLKIHIENQFTDKMTWQNYGTYWHLDHIRPCASFDLTDPDQQKQCFHWSNLQPLEAKENMSKGAKWNGY